jgi:flagellar motor switch protein FliM
MADQILSQDEINSLLRGLSEGTAEKDDVAQVESNSNIKKYDLASQERIVRGRMPTLELIHDRFARQFRTQLSKFLGRSVFVNVGGIEMVKFGLFMKKLPLPSSLHIYRMPPFSGYALMVVSSSLVCSIVDSLFGGPGEGRGRVDGREFTSIESRLIGKVVLMALDTLKEAWGPIHPIDFVYVRSEFNPLAVAICPPTDVVIIVTIEVELEQDSTSITLCIPYQTVEPLRQKLVAGFQSTRLESDNSYKKRIQSSVMETKAELSVELARGQLSADQLLKMKVGDVLTLETNPSEEAVIKIEGTPKYYGQVGSFRGNRAASVSRIISEEDLVRFFRT